MRMWLVNPKLLCKKHLLGEHVECHMFVGTINKNKCLSGYFNNKLLCVEKLKERHEELANELISRGYKHNSILPEFEIKDIHKGGNIFIDLNKKELCDRCEECRRLIKNEN